MNKKTVVVVGAGQLARFLAIECHHLEIESCVIYHNKYDPACACATYSISHQDEKLKGMLQSSTVVTFENENPNSSSIELIKKLNVEHYPSIEIINTFGQRIEEKKFLSNLKIPIVPYCIINSDTDLSNTRFLPGVLKTNRGYDGKGQHIVHDLNHIKKYLKEEILYVLEKKINIAREFSVIMAFDQNKDYFIYPLTENYHHNGILRTSHPIPKDKYTSYAQKIVMQIASAIKYIGVLSVEFFQDTEGKTYVNEIAPRVHNSGHWTLDCGGANQFEQHIRCIYGAALRKDPILLYPSMHNIIGPFDKKKILSSKGKVYLYHKKEKRNNRKTGHINYLST